MIRSFLHSIVSAFSTFSRVPVPTIKWDENSMRYLMATLPFVGVVIGLVLAAWCWLCNMLGFGVVLRSAGIALVPIIVSGGIHMDGFCDVIDALASHGTPEQRREILKDPHTGAFASIGVGVFLVAYVAFASEVPIAVLTEVIFDASVDAPTGISTGIIPSANDWAPLDWSSVILLCLIPVLSRVFGGSASLLGARSKNEGMLSFFQQSAGKSGKVANLAILAIWFVACCIVGCLANWPIFLVMLAGGLIVFLCVFPFARRKFGGMSGDLAGFLIETSDLVMLACLAIASILL